jgi:hypothetical protein
MSIFRAALKDVLQLRKVRKRIVVLQNIRLQQPAMIWRPVQDWSGRQALTVFRSLRVPSSLFP